MDTEDLMNAQDLASNCSVYCVNCCVVIDINLDQDYCVTVWLSELESPLYQQQNSWHQVYTYNICKYNVSLIAILNYIAVSKCEHRV